jgi:hypothetical protein
LGNFGYGRTERRAFFDLLGVDQFSGGH